MATNSPSLEVFATPQDRANWIGQDYTRMISFTVLHNPRGTYEQIKRSWPQYPNLGVGVEQTDAAQEDMYQFLVRQAQDSGDAMQFAAQLAASIPANHYMDNLWLKK